MTPQELRTSIFQYAVQGKLVEQRPEEGTSEELFQQIQLEKHTLIKSGVFKKDKPLPEIVENEIPFDIPDTWKWVRLDNIVAKSIKRGKSPTYTAKSGTLVFAQKCNTKAGYIDLDIALYLDESKLDKYPDEEFMQDKDIVINSTGNGTLGRVGVYRDTDNPRNLSIVPDSHVTVIRANSSISVDYVYYVLKYYQPYMEKLGTGSTNQTELSANIVRALLFPLPPVAEQKRIVAKLEEILPLIDRYEAAWNKLEEFNKRFPGDMQKSILQMAIQGKLVPQLSEEGTGEELYLKIRTHKKLLLGEKKESKLASEQFKDDELPYDIPDTWKWVRFGHIMINRDAERIPLSVDEREKLAKKYDYYGASGVIDKVDRYLFDKKLLLIGEDGANLLARSTPIAFLANGQYWVNNHAHVLDCNDELLCMEYIMWFINAINLAPYVTGTAQPKMNQQKMNSIPIALPPLEEQKRIVAKLEEILPLCERLK